MTVREPILFRDGDETLTLWPEKTYEDGYVVGWCPERSNNIVVHPNNLLPQVDEKKTCKDCGDTYINWGAHAERCFGRPAKAKP